MRIDPTLLTDVAALLKSIWLYRADPATSMTERGRLTTAGLG
jgi:hypothetical protein